jgi:GT2 family glycosyltransferase
MNEPLVAIIVVSWNKKADTLACLASLLKVDYQNHKIIVIDNGSTDQTSEALRTTYPLIRLIENPSNLGFVEANNIGLKLAATWDAKYAILLNNDTVVAPDFLTHLVDAMESDPNAAAAGPMIYYDEQPEMIWSAGGAIDWQTGQTTMIGLNERDVGQYLSIPRSTDFITGCALLVRMTTVQEIGLLDPRFFAYYEEVEWCVRMTRKGFRILFIPLSKVWHKISPLEQQVSPVVHYYMTRNRLLFLRTTQAPWTAWFYTLFHDYLRTITSWSLRPKWRNLRSQRNIMVQAIVDFAKGHTGPVDLP